MPKSPVSILIPKETTQPITANTAIFTTFFSYIIKFLSEHLILDNIRHNHFYVEDVVVSSKL